LGEGIASFLGLRVVAAAYPLFGFGRKWPPHRSRTMGIGGDSAEKGKGPGRLPSEALGWLRGAQWMVGEPLPFRLVLVLPSARRRG